MERLSKYIRSKPAYPERILQIGEGNFMRGFIDWQIHKLNEETDFKGSAVVVPPRRGSIETLNEQDGLYTLYLEGFQEGREIRESTVITALSRGISSYEHYDEFMAVADQPDLRFVFSNTTEAGISFMEEDRLSDRPQKSFPGKLTAFLYRRYLTFNGSEQKGLVMIPCELLDDNGDELKEIVLRYADLWGLEKGFSEWIERANAFCNTLVDRIVPGFPKDKVAELEEAAGYRDSLIVTAEPYHLFVIDGPDWLKKELPLHEAGLNAVFVDDVAPYRVRKVRILNGAHTAMTPVAYLAGLDTVREAAEDDLVGSFVKDLLTYEVIPTIDLPEQQLTAYADEILDRFRNPFIRHQLLDISLNSFAKFKVRNLPVIMEHLNKNGKLPQRTVFALGALICFYKGKRGHSDIPLADDPETLSFLKMIWTDETDAAEIARRVLGSEKLWGQNLNEWPDLAAMVAQHIEDIEQTGMTESLKKLMNSQRLKLGDLS
ncbi:MULTISPECIES: tagaturonate reductase [Bacillus]|uniref:tagaturonate reductase n=1 Tax=Bacillus TaxID=1386 RepID=UPI0015819A5F|nr:tagaturonate reductase [Bacillus glycinifermentans]MBU8785520.1 tagaturonate reductase [Bacillus glycinifermentans]NUJ15839.1 tagaturonate reductase [Bacillus glycinifermentans]